VSCGNILEHDLREGCNKVRLSGHSKVLLHSHGSNRTFAWLSSGYEPYLGFSVLNYADTRIQEVPMVAPAVFVRLRL
jgi:hypothetical protein